MSVADDDSGGGKVEARKRMLQSESTIMRENQENVDNEFRQIDTALERSQVRSRPRHFDYYH